jgi:hypothetical protein
MYVGQQAPEDCTKADRVVHMEKLPINNGNGQSYGFVLYRRSGLTVNNLATLQLKGGEFYDMGIVLLDGERKTNKLKSAMRRNAFDNWVFE